MDPATPWLIVNTYQVALSCTTLAIFVSNPRYVRIQSSVNNEIVSSNYLDTTTLQLNGSFDRLREACTRYAEEIEDQGYLERCRARNTATVIESAEESGQESDESINTSNRTRTTDESINTIPGSTRPPRGTI